MRLPHADRAVVPEAKITHHLLNLNRPEGRDQAVSFPGHGSS